MSVQSDTKEGEGESVASVLGERGDYIAVATASLADDYLDPAETVDSCDVAELREALDDVDGLLDRLE